MWLGRKAAPMPNLGNLPGISARFTRTIAGQVTMQAVRARESFMPQSLLAAGVLRAINPVVGGTMGLKEAARAHREIMSEGAFGKIVLIP